MKKKLLIILTIAMMASVTNLVSAKTDSEITEAIKLYKAQNYTECYTRLTEYVKDDPADALAYYYLAISATQLGKREEAVDFYNKTLSLVPLTSNIGKYAAKGKLCLEDEEACQKAETLVNITTSIKKGDTSSLSSPEVNREFERLKIENLMREMNRNGDIPAQRFKEFKDFSSLNTNTTPTNDEIVAALRILQRAGLSNIGNNYSELSLLTGNQNNEMLNLMGGNMNPQMIQALFSNNMSLGF